MGATFDFGGKDKAHFGGLVLTDHGVYMVRDRGFFGRAAMGVPLSAVDQVFVGWRRLPLLLVLAMVVGASALGFRLIPLFRQESIPVAVLALVLLALFWFVRPSRISVKSGKTELFSPVSAPPEAEAFARLVLEATSHARQVTGAMTLPSPVPVFAVHPPGAKPAPAAAAARTVPTGSQPAASPETAQPVAGGPPTRPPRLPGT